MGDNNKSFHADYDDNFDKIEIDLKSKGSKEEVLTIKCSKELFEQIKSLKKIDFGKITFEELSLKTSDHDQINLILDWAEKKEFIIPRNKPFMEDFTPFPPFGN